MAETSRVHDNATKNRQIKSSQLQSELFAIGERVLALIHHVGLHHHQGGRHHHRVRIRGGRRHVEALRRLNGHAVAARLIHHAHLRLPVDLHCLHLARHGASRREEDQRRIRRRSVVSCAAANTEDDNDDNHDDQAYDAGPYARKDNTNRAKRHARTIRVGRGGAV